MKVTLSSVVVVMSLALHARAQQDFKVAALVKQNKTQDEVVAAKPAAEFDSKITGATPMTADRFVGQLYQELKAGR